MPLYFAYGTDLQNDDWLAPATELLQGQLRPEPSAYAVLPEFALAFRRSTVATNSLFCTLADAAGQFVWGLLINLPEEVLKKLAEVRVETHDRVQKTVMVQRLNQNTPSQTQLAVGEKTMATCFTAKTEVSSAVLPDGYLLRQVLGAALQQGFPISYIRALAAAGVGTGLTVDNIKVTAKDLTEQVIEQIHYKAPPRFAVYATAKKVMVQYADDNLLEAKQRADMASLNGLRSQIAGLIDGWQTHWRARKRCKAAKYNARVAAALNLCLEGDGINAFASLQEVKSDILDERASWGRFEYLISALTAAIVYCVVLGLLQWNHGSTLGDTISLFRAAEAGAIGAFFSIAIAIRQRTVLTDLRWVDNLADAALRVTIGVIAAAVLSLLLRTNLAPPLTLGGATTTAITGPKVAWDIVVTFGFIAGFLERLVPDMLSKVATSTANGGPKGK